MLAYLLTPGMQPPRIRWGEAIDFLATLADKGAFISNDDSLRQLVARSARVELDWLISQQLAESFKRTSPSRVGHAEVPPEVLARAFGPLFDVFRSYTLVVLPVGETSHSAKTERFARTIANIEGDGILALMPTSPIGSAIDLINPLAGTRDALVRRDEWPGAIFTLAPTEYGSYPSTPRRQGQAGGDTRSQFLPLDRAQEAVGEIADVFSRHGSRSDKVFSADRILQSYASDHASQRRTILHLSDLHFGTSEAARSVGLLQAQLARDLPSIDRVVITGDLFDQPRTEYLKQFEHFKNGLKLLGASDPIVVPGNHDSRRWGNAWWKIGRRYRALAELDWSPISIDEDLELVFLGFDSARKGNLARGEVDRDQLVRAATDFDSRNVSGKYDNYLRVALVHHHPYPYDTSGELPIYDPRGWVGREAFVQMEHADRFRSWCAGRRVNLILHGHKHVPRLIRSRERAGSGQEVFITTAGCGSSLNLGGRGLSYNIVSWAADSGTWSVDFRLDPGDGSGFYSAGIHSDVGVGV